MTTRVILDTDIGTDVDDFVALALILTSPEFELEGVSCVYGNVLLRARMVCKMLSLRHRQNVPVYVGAGPSLLGLRPVYWGGHEGKGFLTQEDDAFQPEVEHSVNYIVRKVMENPGQIHLIAIGPLTNIALAFSLEPRLAENLAHLTIMGGVFRYNNRFAFPLVEHNIRCDPEAAHIVFSSGAPITLVPLDVTLLTKAKKADIERIRSGGSYFHQAVAAQLSVYPFFVEHGWTCMHDPLAIASIIRPDLLIFKEYFVRVEMDGRMSTAVTLADAPTKENPANMRVAVDVDAPRFVDFLTGTISG